MAECTSCKEKQKFMDEFNQIFQKVCNRLTESEAEFDDIYALSAAQELENARLKTVLDYIITEHNIGLTNVCNELTEYFASPESSRPPLPTFLDAFADQRVSSYEQLCKKEHAAHVARIRRGIENATMDAECFKKDVAKFSGTVASKEYLHLRQVLGKLVERLESMDVRNEKSLKDQRRDLIKLIGNLGDELLKKVS